MKLLLIGEIDLTDNWFAQFIAELQELLPDADLRIFPDCGAFEDFEIALAWQPPLGALVKFPNLKLVISLGAGVEHILRDPDLPKNISLVSTAPSSQILQMVEYVNLAVLFFQRRLLDYQQLQRSHQWQYLPAYDSKSFTIGIMGLGRLGLAVAKTLKDSGFTVRGWNRSKKTLPGIACFSGQEELKLFLNKSHVLVCLLPLTSATKNILNLNLFSALPQEAYLVNVGRGQHLVEEDLLNALDSGQLAGAFLDCVYPEPLPKEHPFWGHPKIIVTPHAAAPGTTTEMTYQIINTINNFQNGLSLKNLVDLSD